MPHRAQRRNPGIVLSLSVMFVFLVGCENVIHNMYDQPKYKPFEKSEFFPDGQSARPRVADTAAYSAGALASASSGRAGLIMPAESEIKQERIPFLVTPQLLQRGRERYNIYCMPCHGTAGEGDGKVVRRGFPSPPSYHSERLRSMPDVHFYQVMTQGFGRMFSYADRVEPRDRWAIVAYIRVLQSNQEMALEKIAEVSPRSLETE